MESIWLLIIFLVGPGDNGIRAEVMEFPNRHMCEVALERAWDTQPDDRILKATCYQKE